MISFHILCEYLIPRDATNNSIHLVKSIVIGTESANALFSDVGVCVRSSLFFTLNNEIIVSGHIFVLRNVYSNKGFVFIANAPLSSNFQNRSFSVGATLLEQIILVLTFHLFQCLSFARIRFSLHSDARSHRYCCVSTCFLNFSQ